MAAAGTTAYQDPGITRRADAALDRVRAEHPGLALRGTLVLGEPDEVLLRHAATACLVVLGHTPAAGHELGPVTQLWVHVRPWSGARCYAMAAMLPSSK